MKRTLILLSLWLMCQLGYVLTSVISLFAIFTKPDIAWRVLLASDRLINSAIGGDDRETISSRSYRESLKGVLVWCVLCKLLNKIQKDHCERSEGI
jgi:hypothetical protein